MHFAGVSCKMTLSFAELSERLKEHDWKSCVGQKLTGSSNLPLCASKIRGLAPSDFAVVTNTVGDLRVERRTIFNSPVGCECAATGGVASPTGFGGPCRRNEAIAGAIGLRANCMRTVTFAANCTARCAVHRGAPPKAQISHHLSTKRGTPRPHYFRPRAAQAVGAVARGAK